MAEERFRKEETLEMRRRLIGHPYLTLTEAYTERSIPIQAKLMLIQ